MEFLINNSSFQLHRWCQLVVFRRQQNVDQAEILDLLNAGKVFVEDNNLIFWFEAIGIWAFALSWLVKSKADMILAERLMRRRTTD